MGSKENHCLEKDSICFYINSLERSAFYFSPSNDRRAHPVRQHGPPKDVNRMSIFECLLCSAGCSGKKLAIAHAGIRKQPLGKGTGRNCRHKWGHMQFCCHLQLLLDHICYENIYI
jgi:hypothetical protein